MVFKVSYIAAEAYKGFRRNLLLAFSMVIIVAISLTMFGVALLAGSQVQLLGGYWADRVEVSMFLTTSVTEEQRQSIRKQLDELPVVEEVFYESKDEAYQHFKEQFKDSPDLVRNVSPEVLPESFRVKLTDPERYPLVHDTFCSGQENDRGKEICNPGIEQVQNQKELIEDLFTVLNYFRLAFIGLAIVLGLAAFILIGVTVRVAAFARRKETQIMKLVGASNTYIRLPFLAEGVVAGLMGTAIAFGLLRVLMEVIERSRDVVPIFGVMPLVGMSEFYSAMFALLLLGIASSALASLLGLRKYIRV